MNPSDRAAIASTRKLTADLEAMRLKWATELQKRIKAEKRAEAAEALLAKAATR
jgi:hypothetical protein